MAKAYFIGQFEIHDPAGYDVYRSQTAATIAAHGGRFIARGGRVHNFEGEPPLPRVVVIELRPGEGLVRLRGLSKADPDPPEGRQGPLLPRRRRGVANPLQPHISLVTKRP